MQIPVFKQMHHKSPYIIASAILFVFAAILCVILFVADVYRSAGLIAVVVVAAMSAIDFVGAIFFVALAFPSVSIDETGVSLYLGKIKLNKLTWSSVKRVEVVRIKADSSLIINVMTTETPGFSFRKGIIVSNVNKKRITFEYDGKALDYITQKYQGHIYGIEETYQTDK